MVDIDSSFLRTLTPLVLVRVQVPQPTWTKACIFLQVFVFIEFFEFERSIFRTRRKTVFSARKPLIFCQFADFRRILKFIERIAQFITDPALVQLQTPRRRFVNGCGSAGVLRRRIEEMKLFRR